MKQEWYAVSRLAGQAGLSAHRKSIIAKAEREGWLSRPRQGKGGGREYHYSSLPTETQRALGFEPSVDKTEAEGRPDRATVEENAIPPSVSSSAQPAEAGGGDGNLVSHGLDMDMGTQPISAPVPSPEPESPGLWMLENAYSFERPDGATAEVRQQARALLLQLVEPWCIKNRVDGATDCEYAFAKAYCRGQIAVPDWVRLHCQGLSRSTLHRWRQLRKAPTLPGKAINPLGGLYRPTRQNLIRANQELEKVVWHLLSEQTIVGAGPRNIYKRLTKLNLPEGMRPSYQQVLRYLQWFQSERRAQYLMLVSPKDYRNKIELAIGRLDQDLAPNQRWQLDFTRNDVLLRMPGIDQPQRFAVGMVLDVATRRRKVLLSPVPKDETTALLLLGAIEEWGVPTEIRPDNGKEFINKRVQSLCQALGIIINPCIPGRPQEKGNVERGLGDLVRRMQTQPSFVGHNVLQRQQIREAKGEQYLLEAAPSFDEFQAWLDQQIEEIHETPHNGVGMEGMSPNERLDDFIARGWQPTVATLEAAELRRLVYSAEVTARRDCIVWKTRRYITEHLAQVSAGDRLRVCMDGNDLRQIHIYSLDMQTYYGVARWEICLSKKELIAAAERGKALQRGSHKASKAGAKEGAKIAAKWQERPDLAVGAHSTQAAAQQVSAAHAAALRDELSSAVDTPPPVGDNRPQLVVVRSAPTPEPAAADEEPDFWNDRWIWAAWQYKRGDWKTDDRKRQDMVERFLEHPFLTAHQLGMKEDPDGFAAIGEEIGMTWMEKEKLRSELEQHQRTQQLIAEQARRRFG